MDKVIREWCNGKVHILVLPLNFIENLTLFSFNKKLSKKTKTHKIFSKICDLTCPIFLENGVDECGCFIGPDLEMK